MLLSHEAKEDMFGGVHILTEDMKDTCVASIGTVKRTAALGNESHLRRCGNVDAF
jgi:hypothetical protein